MALDTSLVDDLHELFRSPPETQRELAEAWAALLEKHFGSEPDPEPEPDPGPDPEPDPDPEPEPEPEPDPGPNVRLHAPDNLGRFGVLDDVASGMGVGVGVNPGDAREYAGDIKKAGFEWIRTRLYGPNIEKTKGDYNWTVAPNYDRLVDAFNDIGIDVLYMFQLSSNGGIYQLPYTNPDHRRNFANFAAAAAKHWRDKKVMFELGNEPNIGNFWPIEDYDRDSLRKAADDYASFAEVVVPAMRDANPDVFIVSAGLAGRGGPQGFNSARHYFERLVERGTFDLFDRVALHPYTAEGKDPELVMGEGRAPEESDVPLYRALLGGSDVPIWNTEQGWKSDGSSNQNHLQAAYNIRDHLWGLFTNVPIRFCYYWSKSPNRSYAMHDRPAAEAFAVLKRELGGSYMTRRVPTINPHHFVFEFRHPASGQTRVAAWKRDANTPEQYLYSHSEEVTVVSMFGDAYGVMPDPSSKMVPLNLSVAPMYVRLS